MSRLLSQIGHYICDAVLLTYYGISRLWTSSRSGGDTYDAKVIFAGDLSDLGGHRLASFWLGRLIASAPGRPRAYFERGMALLELHNDAAALKDFERCLSIDANFPGAKDWYERTKKSTAA